MALPNFFIIGAPKSGTTALYQAIRSHPDVFMSPVKEPRYFAFDGQPPVLNGPAGDYWQKSIWQRRDYFQLFANANGQKVIGEASPVYLRIPQAAERIRKNLPLSRIVAILRQPADRAYSHFMYMRQKNVEPLQSFSAALAEEQARIQKGWFSGFYYKENGKYHTQLSVYYHLFPSEQIKIYLYEDWKKQPQAVLRDLFCFLEIDEEYQPIITQSNVTVTKYPPLHNQ